MTEQQTMFPEEKKPERDCYACRHFSELKAPRERADGAVIYGYCFKDGTKNYSSNMGKGYAVFLPGASCKDFKEMR